MKKLDIRTVQDVIDLREIFDRYRNGSGRDMVIRAYKYVNANLESPWVLDRDWNYRYLCLRPIEYGLGTTPEVMDADTNPSNECGRGINVGSLNYCTYSMHWPLSISEIVRNSYKSTARFVAVEFKLSDIAAMPVTHDVCSKFRLFRCKVVGEVNTDSKLISWLWKGRAVRRHNGT